MNSQQCLAGASAVQEEGTPHLLLCSVQIFVSWMGKVRVINPMKLFQLEGGGKIVSKCFCFKGTTDFPSPRISSVWMLSAAAHNWKKQLQNDFITDLSFLNSDWKLPYVTRFTANSIPCQWGSLSAMLERAPAVESRPCSAPRLSSPGTCLGSDHTHTTRELAWHACSNQPCSQVWPQGFAVPLKPSDQADHGHPAATWFPQAPETDAAAASLPTES